MKVTYEEKEYTLTGDAQLTGRIVPGMTNYHEAEDGEAYWFEMSAPAVDSDGKPCTVYWVFETVKGEDSRPLDEYDYSVAHRVEY